MKPFNIIIGGEDWDVNLPRQTHRKITFVHNISAVIHVMEHLNCKCHRRLASADELYKVEQVFTIDEHLSFVIEVRDAGVDTECLYDG